MAFTEQFQSPKTNCGFRESLGRVPESGGSFLPSGLSDYLCERGSQLSLHGQFQPSWWHLLLWVSEMDIRFTDSSELVTGLHAFTLQDRLTLGQLSEKFLGLCSLVLQHFRSTKFARTHSPTISGGTHFSLRVTVTLLAGPWFTSPCVPGGWDLAGRLHDLVTRDWILRSVPLK